MFCRFTFVFLAVLLFNSCPFDFDNIKENDRRYKTTIEWEREFLGSVYGSIQVNGQYCYFVTRIRPGSGYLINKVDLDTGKAIWETKKIDSSWGGVLRVDEYIYYSVDSLTYVFNDLDGSLAEIDSTLNIGDFTDLNPVTSNPEVLYNNRRYYKINTGNGYGKIAATDVDTGNIVWEANLIDDYLSEPRVYENRLYMTNSNGIYVYDTSKNGKNSFLGVDKSFSVHRSFIYKDLLVFDTDGYDNNFLIAIKM